MTRKYLKRGYFTAPPEGGKKIMLYGLWSYRVYKGILQVDKVVDFKYKNALLDQNVSFTWSAEPSNIDLKQKYVGQIHKYVRIFKKAQEVKIPLCPSKVLTHAKLTYTKHAALPLIFFHQFN